jgi:DNA-binding NarL/FixJ family response regulator
MTPIVTRSATAAAPPLSAPPRMRPMQRALGPTVAPGLESLLSNGAISIGLIGGQRLMREATANLIAAQEGLELHGTFPSTAAFLTAERRQPPGLLLVDCDGGAEPWLAALTTLATARVPSLIAMLCHEVSQDIANYAIGNGVSGVILKSDSARDIRDSITYMSSGRTVLPEGWQQAAAAVPREHLRLSPRHREILGMIARGASNEEIADALALSPNTVKFHVRALYARLEVRNRVEAAGRYAQMAADAR